MSTQAKLVAPLPPVKLKREHMCGIYLHLVRPSCFKLYRSRSLRSLHRCFRSTAAGDLNRFTTIYITFPPHPAQGLGSVSQYSVSSRLYRTPAQSRGLKGPGQGWEGEPVNQALCYISGPPHSPVSRECHGGRFHLPNNTHDSDVI